MKEKLYFFLTILVLFVLLGSKSMARYEWDGKSIPRKYTGWSIEANLQTGVILKVEEGPFFDNLSSNQPYHFGSSTFQASFATSVTGSLSEEISASIGGEDSGNLGMNITSLLQTTVTEERTQVVDCFPTDTKMGAEWVPANTVWKTKMITKGRILSGYAKKYELWFCKESGSYNVKVPESVSPYYIYEKQF